MKKRYKLAVLIFLIFASMTITASAIEMSQFKSGISTKAGIEVDFNTLYSRANAVYDVIEHDNNHIIWKFAETTGDWAFLDRNGTLIVASASMINLEVKNKFEEEVNEVVSTVKLAGGTISVEQPIYYSDESKVYRRIQQDFDANFEYYLNVPNCTINQATLSVSGQDSASCGCQGISQYGQHYNIDGKEVSGCDLVSDCGLDSPSPSGISCRESSGIRIYNGWVTVNPVDIAMNIPMGLHTITSSGIDSKHTMTIDAITTPSTKPIVLYNKPKTVWVEDTQSQSLGDLYALIMSTAKTTSETSTNSTTNTTT